MKKELNMEELDSVVGGVVYLSKDWMKIGFSTLGQTFSLQNCTFGQAFALADSIYEQYKDQGNAVVDQKTKEAFENKGWI